METYEELYKNICRVCLSFSNNNNMVCLTDKSSKDGLSCYGKAVGQFAKIIIKENDDLPKCMCENCLKILKYAIYFKLKCESSDKHLSRLYKIHKESGSNLQETVVDFLMYNQYFPQESSLNSSSKVSESKSEKTHTEINGKLANDFDNSYIENDSTSFGDLSKESTDEDSNIIENIAGVSSNKSHVDEELNMLEKIVAQSSCIGPKSNYKTLKKRKLVIRKNLQEKKSFISQRKLQRQLNMSTDTNVTEKPLEKLICKICQKELANQQTYRYHMERHNGCKFICEHCGKGFPVLVELHMHQVARHGTGPFLQCPHCTYKAPRRLTLIEHIRIHTGERPYTCDKCGLTFRRSAIWKKHMVYHREKTVQCPHCPKKFYRRGEMLAHANSIHERMYVYLCHKCDATYAKSGTVRRHLTERHGIPREMQGKITRVNKGEVYGIL